MSSKKFTKRIIFEIILSVAFVFIGTFFVYGRLAGITSFWSSQMFWNIVLAICWSIVSFGYFHQGMLVHHRKSSDGVSILLPCAVFFVQCILFVKGIFYHDWSLILGAVIVNSGVVFSLYQIWKYKN